MPSSRGSSPLRDQTCISCGSCIAGGFFTAEPLEKVMHNWLPVICRFETKDYFYVIIQFSSVWSLSPVRLSATPWTAARQASLSITNSWSLLKPMPIELVMPFNHLILCCAFSSCSQSFPASGSFQMSQLFESSGQSIGVSASAISPSNEYSGLISFRMDWLDLLAVQGTLESLLQHHSSKASVLLHSAFL